MDRGPARRATQRGTGAGRRLTGHSVEPSLEFPCRSARAGAVTAGFALAIVIETLVVHLWLVAAHPRWAWSLTTLGVASLLYLAVEYRALGRGVVRVTPESVSFGVAGRVTAELPRAALSEARPFTWRDVPEGSARGYLNAMAPAEPNVLLVFTTPMRVGIAWGLVHRRMERVALRVDDPTGFLSVVQRTPAH